MDEEPGHGLLSDALNRNDEGASDTLLLSSSAFFPSLFLSIHIPHGFTFLASQSPLSFSSPTDVCTRD